MSTDLDSGLTGVLLEEGDHLCAMYRGDDQRDRLLSSILGAGVRSGDNCLWVSDEVGSKELGALLAQDASPAGTDTVEVSNAADVYLPEGRFDPQSTVQLWDLRAKELTAETGRPTRAMAEMSWSLAHRPKADGLMDYENLLNGMIPGNRLLGVCFYDLDQFGWSVVPDLLVTHPKVLIGEQQFASPLFEGNACGDGIDTLIALLATCGSEEEVDSCLFDLLPRFIGCDLVVREAGGVVKGVLDGEQLSPASAREAIDAHLNESCQDLGLPGRLVTESYPLVVGGERAGDVVLGWRSAPDSNGPEQKAPGVLREGAEASRPALLGAFFTQMAATTAWITIEERAGGASQQTDAAALRAIADQLVFGDRLPIDLRLRAARVGFDILGIDRVSAIGPKGSRSLTRWLAALLRSGVAATIHQGFVIAFTHADTGLGLEMSELEPFTLGIGSTFNPMDPVEPSVVAACHAAEMARLGGPPVRFEEVGVFRLLHSARESGTLEEFVDKWLGPLLRYDEMRAGNLVITLRTYLDQGASKVATAGTLGIHISTLRHRLRRIDEIGDVHIADASVRFHLQLALEALTVSGEGL